jgi:hypothetical protein
MQTGAKIIGIPPTGQPSRSHQTGPLSVSGGATIEAFRKTGYGA